MKRSRNASLKHLNSFSVEARAARIIELECEEDLHILAAEHQFNQETDLILGGGSNILFVGDVNGSVILNRVRGKRVLGESATGVLVEAFAGENWHQLVLWSLDQGLSGIENLSLIPGLTGAAPMQNIGAYGVELAEVIDSVQVLDLATGEVAEFGSHECLFAYRDSRFKSQDAGRFLITKVRLCLQRTFKPRLDYAGIAEELKAMGVSRPTARQVSNAVIRIRQRKLPDPAIVGNAGSFFKNPVVEPETADRLASKFDGLPIYRREDGSTKLSAAWMIDDCGWKGHREGDAGVSDQHALVLVNYGSASGRHLLDLANAIAESVRDRFGVELVPEPRIFR
jgi:UDP-N-acetylmuramate dehydrogenase